MPKSGDVVRPLFPLALATFAVGTDAFVIAGLLPAIATDLDVSIPAAGQLVTVFALTLAIAAPVLSWLLSPLDRRKALQLTLVVFVVSNIVTALSPTYLLALLARILTVAITPAERRGRAMAVVIGWLTTTDNDLYGRLREAKFVTTVACSTVDEFLATQLLHRRDEVLAPRAKRLEQALTELLSWAHNQPVEIVRPDGGAMCCLRLPTDRFSDDEVATFYARLAERDTRVAPGSWFGEHDWVFRLGFGHLPADDFTTALDRLADTLSNSR